MLLQRDLKSIRTMGRSLIDENQLKLSDEQLRFNILVDTLLCNLL